MCRRSWNLNSVIRALATYSPQPVNITSKGLGWLIGFQITASTVQTVTDLAGPAIDAGVMARLLVWTQHTQLQIPLSRCN